MKALKLSYTKKFTFSFFLLSMSFGCSNRPEMKVGSHSKSSESVSALHSVALNSCENKETSFKASQNLNSNIESSEVYIASVQKALSSVPSHLASFYFSLGGRIEVNTEKFGECLEQTVNSISQDDSSVGSAKRASSCWQLENGRYSLYMPENNDLIEHGLVRGFAMVLIKSMALPASQEQDSLLSDRRAIEEKFSEDLNDRDDLSVNVLDRIETLEGADEEVYLDEVFAESFDAFYCSIETREKMRQKLPQTYELFYKRVHPRLIAPMEGATLDGSQSLSLTGGGLLGGAGGGLFGNLLGNLGGAFFGGGGDQGLGGGLFSRFFGGDNQGFGGNFFGNFANAGAGNGGGFFSRFSGGAQLGQETTDQFGFFNFISANDSGQSGDSGLSQLLGSAGGSSCDVGLFTDGSDFTQESTEEATKEPEQETTTETEQELPEEFEEFVKKYDGIDN